MAARLVAARLVAARLVAARLVAASQVAARGRESAKPSQHQASAGVYCYVFARRLDLLYLLTSRLVALISRKAAAGKAAAGQLEAGLLHTLAQTYTCAAGQFEAKLEPT